MSLSYFSRSKTPQPLSNANSNDNDQKTEESTSRSVRFSTMGYNVNFGLLMNSEDLDSDGPRSVKDAIDSSDKDIVCLTETTPNWEFYLKPALSKKYPHQIWWHSDRWCAGGQAVLSRFPIIEAKKLKAPSEWFFVGLFTIAIPEVGPVQVLNAHMRPSLSSGHWTEHFGQFFQAYNERLLDIQEFCKPIDRSQPYLVIGDFNESHSGVFAGQAVEWLRKFFGMENAIDDYCKNQTTWKWPVGWWSLEAAFDHIFYSSHFKCEGAEVVQMGQSDHFPVVADFCFQNNSN